jgi:hypothetical protein
MKRNLFPGVKYSLLIFLLALTACQKFDWDYWHKHNPDCRIEKIRIFQPFGPDTNTAVFKYNHRGQPVSVTFEFVSTGRPNYVFRYDHKGRLTDFIAPYENQHFEQWYKYKYDNNDRIVSDSAFVFGFYIDSVPSPDPMFVPTTGTYEYDYWGRISKTTRTQLPYGTEVLAYAYNSDGNLASVTKSFNGFPQGVDTYTTYDNKVNFLRTNPVWMFLNKDYSKNNRMAAETYNNKGLPTRFRIPTYGKIYLSHQTDLSMSDIWYKCK